MTVEVDERIDGQTDEARPKMNDCCCGHSMVNTAVDRFLTLVVCCYQRHLLIGVSIFNILTIERRSELCVYFSKRIGSRITHKESVGQPTGESLRSFRTSRHERGHRQPDK